MLVTRVKSLLLIALVASSMVLSYMLWHGNWQNTTEVGLSGLSTLPAATYPDAPTVTRPYQVVVTTARSTRYVVLVPGATDYTSWLRRISSLRLSGLHQVPAWTKPTIADSIECDFGALLSTAELLPWMPGLESSTFSLKASSVILYLASPRGPVNVALNSQNGSFVAETDIGANQFSEWLQQSQADPAWLAWNQQVGNYLPGPNVMMAQLEYQTEAASVMPLVGSFFVNPQALTRIQESQQSVIWTDGSRAVRWDQGQGTLTFEDPNVATGNAPAQSNLMAALAYIRTHGGSPKDSVLFSQTSFFNGDNTESYTLQTYANGYPIFGMTGDYTIELQNGHVIRYRRPLLQLTQQVSSRPVQMLTGDALLKALKKLAPSTDPKNLTLEIGYVAQSTAPGTVVLIPAYNVSQSGLSLWSIDAVTGKLIKGMGSE